MSFWATWGTQGERIQAIEDSTDDYDNFLEVVGVWFKHLDEKVKFPLDVLYNGDSNARVKQGTKVTILDIEDYDQEDGVLVKVKNQHGKFQIALCDVDIIEPDKNNEAIDDYVVWFANR